MATQTPRFGLTKPALEDAVDPVAQIAENMQKIDDQVAKQTDLEAALDPAVGHTHTGAAGDGPQIGTGGLADNAVTDAKIGNRTINQALANPANTGLVTSLLSWIAGRLKAILGTTNWYDAPPITLQAIKTHVDATGAGTHGSTAAATADTLMHRDVAGRAKVAAPAAADDIARKDTVDNAIATAVLKGIANTDVQQVRAVIISINDCTLQATSWDSKNRVMAYALKSGATTVATMTYTRDASTGLVTTATIKDGAGVTIQAYQFNWDGKKFVSRTPI